MSTAGSRLAVVAAVVLATVLAGCTHSSSTGTSPSASGATAAGSRPPAGDVPSRQGASSASPQTGTGAAAPTGAVPSDDASWCPTIQRDWPGISGDTVRLAASVTTTEAAALQRSWTDFEACTGGRIQIEPTTRVTQVARSGQPPDIAVLTQPRQLAALAGTRTVVPAPQPVQADVDTYFGPVWKGAGSVDGTLYGVPFDATVDSLVWYSPSMFKDNNYQVPTTWDDMIKLSDAIVAAGEAKPWCAGVAAGAATGRPVTNWLEEVVLRQDGPDVYDRWVSGTVTFSDPAITAALDTVGQILKNPRYVNAGIGDVGSIVTTDVTRAGQPILSGQCYLMQASQAYSWPAGTTVGPEGKVDAFYLPPINNDHGKPVAVSGSFAAALNSAPATQAAQFYLSTAHWANNQAKASAPGVSANRGLQLSSVTGAANRLAVQILQDPDAVVRFDASDLMPAQVSAAELTQLTAWIVGQDDASTLAGIAQAWPRGSR